MMDEHKLTPADPVDPAARKPAIAPAGETVAYRRRRRPSRRRSRGAGPAPVSAAVEKFHSCRWRATPEDGEFCTHRDVLPFAGKDGFVAESWCPDCAFYKLRRTPKKRERVDYTY